MKRLAPGRSEQATPVARVESAELAEPAARVEPAAEVDIASRTVRRFGGAAPNFGCRCGSTRLLPDARFFEA